MTLTTRWTAVAAFTLLAGCQMPAADTVAAPAAPAPHANVPQAGVAPPAAPVTTAAAAAPTPASISAIVNLRSIDATKEFLERTLGASTYETPETAKYLAGGCNVEVSYAANKAVTNVSIDLTPGCRFDAAALVGSQAPVMVDGSLTFAAFEQLFGNARYTSPCLSLCGNAYDPYVDAVVPGSRANLVVDVAARALFVDDAVIAASNAWEAQLKAKAGEDYVVETRFNCDRTHEAIARAAFATVKVETLQFGRELGSNDCG
ncbi:hypothetical protein ACFQZQ_14740 [Lysobacter koreensis]|uniref:Lipoprotein n=1 Tax=Lysobacter koreensis TaxID=266122 RepID=A0ABW2YQ89_9GAMM